VSYNALLEVCLRTNDMPRGCDVLDRMAGEGVDPDDFTAELCAKKRVLRAHFRKTFDF
jgi:pentatricopeptide repeat protein